MTNPLTCKQNNNNNKKKQQKIPTNVENCEKTPTISSLSTVFIRLQNGRKKKVLPPTPFGDVIIHETGTRLTKEGDVRDGNHSQDQTMFHRQGVCKQGGVIEADRKQGRKHNEVDQ